MTLPFADKTELSNLYRQFSSLQLDTITPAEFDAIVEKLFIDGPQEDELRRTLLIGRAMGAISDTNSRSGFINGCDIYSFEFAEDSTGVMLTPAKGELYRLFTFAVTDLGGSNSIIFRLRTFDSKGNQTGERSMDMIDVPYINVTQRWAGIEGTTVINNSASLPTLIDGGGTIDIGFPMQLEAKQRGGGTGNFGVRAVIQRLR